ncbi:MAG: DNA polymerase III subunit beta [Chloroflexi bacterium]|nr:DNA polymerase III subunit beta [Chloroflexota bacterium]
MKVSCLQENLAKGLSIVSRAVAARSTLPVLGNVLVSAENSRLKLSATSLEMGLTCWIGAKVEEEGATTVPARTFVDLVNTLPGDRVEMALTVRTQTLNVRCGSFNNDVKCIDAQEFPLVPEADLDSGVQLNVEDLREIIGQVVLAAATDDTRPTLTGVLAKIESGQVTLAATDGFRLSVRTAHLSTPAADAISVIIPARALSELARIAGDSDQPVILTLPPGRGQVIFHTKDVELVSQLIEGNFPDYPQIIPRAYTTRTVMTTADLLKACKAADIFAREASHTARFKITPGDDFTPGSMQISATSAETGSNETTVDATVDGDELEISFNVKYLVDVLNVIDTPNVALETNSAASPGVIRPVGRDDFLHVIMPMHIGR